MKIGQTILILILFSLSAGADPGDPDNPVCRAPKTSLQSEAEKPFTALLSKSERFCKDPYNAICGSPTVGSITGTASRALVKAQALQFALKATATRLGRDPDKFALSDIFSLPPLEMAAAAVFFSSQLELFLSIYGSNLQISAVLSSAETVKKDLQAAILTQPTNNIFDQFKQYYFAGKVGKIRIVTALEAVNSKATRDEYKNMCGEDGMKIQGYARNLNGEPVIVICPGHLLNALGGGSDVAGNYRNLAWLLAHEFGHHVNYGQDPGAYGKFASCLATYYAGDLANLSYPKWLDTALSALPGVKDKLKALPYLEELSADYWAAQSIAEHFKSTALSYDERVEYLQDAYRFLCEYPGDDGKHGGARLRIEVILRRNFDIHHLMGCDLPETGGRPGCTLEGPTVENLF